MSLLRHAWAGWKRVGRFIGNIVGRVVLTAFHFTLFMPFALAIQATSDPLQLKSPAPGTCWSRRTSTPATIEQCRRLA